MTTCISLALLIALVSAHVASVQATEGPNAIPVDVELVLEVDVSSSMDVSEL